MCCIIDSIFSVTENVLSMVIFTAFIILTGEGRKYLLTYDKQNQGVEEICEIIQYSEKPRSWFVGETVQKGYYCLLHLFYFNNVLICMIPIIRTLLLSCLHRWEPVHVHTCGSNFSYSSIPCEIC